MTPSYLRNILFLFNLCVVYVQCANLAISGEAITTRFWDCCKPSCGWKAKADFNQPVRSCNAQDAPLSDFDAGTGCNGGTAYQCSNQQPWAVNDTFSYGFAGIFITGHVEDFWCCACYQLNFTSDPLKGKSMIVQASNTAYDVTSTNRFSLAVPGGNTTLHDGCSREYSMDQTVFGTTNSGVNSVEDCDNLPESLRDACRWRFEWFQDASYPTANFKRVVCPSELTEKTGCSRNDEKALATNSLGSTISPATSLVVAFTVAVASLLVV